VNETPGLDGAGLQVTDLEARYAALRQASKSAGAEPADVLDAAFTELEGAIDLLRTVAGTVGRPAARPSQGSQPPGSDSAERSLLRAAFQDAPVPLFLLAVHGLCQPAVPGRGSFSAHRGRPDRRTAPDPVRAAGPRRPGAQ
jgi:hypothetical protein